MRALALLVTILSACFSANAQDPGDASISGSVQLSTGEPVPNAAVSFLAPGPPLGTNRAPRLKKATTDGQGRFAVEGLAGGEYNILVNSPDGSLNRGYSMSGPGGRTVVLSAGEKRTGFAITLTPQPSIFGRVFDDNGRPIPGLQVSALRDVFDTGTGRETLVTSDTTTTDEAGNYVMKGLSAGRYYVTAEPIRSDQPAGEPDAPVLVRTYHPSGTRFNMALPVNLELGADAAHVDIRMRAEPTVSLQGVTLDENGDPAPGYILILRSLDGGPLNRDAAPIVTSDDAGRFAFPDLLPGRYLLSSTAHKGDPGPQGVLNGRAEVFLGGESIDDFEFRLQHTADLVFHIRMDDGSPLQNPRRIALLDPDADVFHQGRSDANGDGVIPAMTAGRLAVNSPIMMNDPTYVKSIRYGGQDITNSYLDTTTGVVADLEIVLASNGGSVAGTVRDRSGNPVPDAWVALWPGELGPPNSMRSVIRTQSRTDGSFQFVSGPLAPGEYWLVALDPAAFDGMGEAYAALLKPEFLQALRPNAEQFKLGEGSSVSYTLEPIPAADIQRVLANLP